MIVRQFQKGDNYAYLAGCEETRLFIAVDPVNVRAVLRALEEEEGRLLYVINTHSHPDHTSGNREVMEATGATLLTIDRLSDGAEFRFGEATARAIHTPGHTADGLSILAGSNLFTGDTLFVAGCGNCRFGGDVRQMFETFRGKLMTLPDRTRVHPGHDYAMRNLRFAEKREPGNEAIGRKIDAVMDGQDEPASTIGEEKGYNPFMRFDSPEILEVLKKEDPSQKEDPFSVFAALRARRDNW